MPIEKDRNSSSSAGSRQWHLIERRFILTAAAVLGRAQPEPAASELGKVRRGYAKRSRLRDQLLLVVFKQAMRRG